MSGFKLIAIIPLKGCNSQFSKKLKVETAYQFYQQFVIQMNKDGSQVLHATKKTDDLVPEKLYELKNGIIINFSAVVGMNGSGKSTLFELLFYIIYKLGTIPTSGSDPIMTTAEKDLGNEHNRILQDFRKFNEVAGLNSSGSPSTISDGVTLGQNVEHLALEMIQRYNLYVNTKRGDERSDLYRIISAALHSKLSDKHYEWEEASRFDKLAIEGFNVSVVYQLDNEIMELHCSGGEIKFYKLFENDQKELVTAENFDLSSFFYTIGINYSHHSLNTRTLGKWINKLFHKNDAYRTPLVINPMRNDGNFDINHEIHLSKERLMSTLVYDLLAGKKDGPLGKYQVNKFIFFMKRAPARAVFTPEDFKKLPSAGIISELYGLGHVDSELPYGELAINYLDTKISKVYEKYRFLMAKNGDKTDVLKDFLSKDSSHVTKKIRQTVNYLRNMGKEIHTKTWSGTNGGLTVEISPDEMVDYLKLFKIDLDASSPADIIEYALPGFFNIDFEFKDLQDKRIKLSQMSSGEQQMIFNTNSILYHLYNIQSAHTAAMHSDDRQEKGIKRPAYRAVNIILDEMELYYHPEMQRQLVSGLMEAFRSLKTKGGIHSINICISTHSPFILSDIPVQNILRLGKLEMSDEQTFAANIHDLLRNEFFLENGYMGTFAASKLSTLVDHLRAWSLFNAGRTDDVLQLELSKIELGGTSRPLAVAEKGELMSKGQCEKLIGLVGEPVLRLSLIELFLKAFPEDRENYLNKQIEYLISLKNNKTVI